MDIEAILKENEMLKQKVVELEEKLKKYTNPQSCKNFYEKNKEKIIQTSNERLKNLNSDKLKEYRRNAYLKRKEKLKSENIKD